VAAAQPGDTVVLGAGTYTLSETLRIGAGVSLKGAGPGRTVLDAAGLGVGVSFENSSADRESVMEGVTVHGAETCVKVGAGRSPVRLTRAIVRDCREEGVSVEANGIAKIINVTLVETGVGVHAAGATEIKNSILTGNRVGLLAKAGTALATSYNGLFDNAEDYEGVVAGRGDLAEPVSFADLAKRDLRLVASQPTTDRGDPADAVGDEPSPNGGRINMGAFGGTPDAERSALSTAVSTGPATGAPSVSPSMTGAPPNGVGTDGPVDGKGCSVAGGQPANGLVLLGLVALIALSRYRRRQGDPTRQATNGKRRPS
jgi:MYXO-CTERM domain-containing protein